MSNSYAKTTKAQFYRDLTSPNSSWVYVWGGMVKVGKDYDLQFIIESFYDWVNSAISDGRFCEHRTYTKRSFGAVSNTGSEIRLCKDDTVYKFDHGYIVDTGYSVFGYVYGNEIN